ncbi:hypothetical protein SASPL_154136 [Salvia splendens]|uniref:Protein kinase domain-containing protein n=1 Tax=Salvia splendens TaxID=180675 RepID=A0A8X8YZ17_SALSN|nr:hypothetical protein SASPL_154136 [Salvia splendens]
MSLAESRSWPLNPALLTAPPFLNQQPVAASDEHPPSLYSAPSNPKFSYDSLELIADVTVASKKPCPITAIDQLLDRDHVGAEGVFLDDEEKVGILTVALECMPTGPDYWATTYISDDSILETAANKTGDRVAVSSDIGSVSNVAIRLPNSLAVDERKFTFDSVFDDKSGDLLDPTQWEFEIKGPAKILHWAQLMVHTHALKPKLASRRQFSQVMPLFMKRRIHGCPSFDPEGYALLQFRAKVNFDPSGALASWNPDDCSPCSWLGVHCLDERELALNIRHVHPRGFILVHPEPLDEDLVDCPTLALANSSRQYLFRDLNGRDLVGLLVPELANLSHLRVLFLCNNGFERRIPFEIGRLIFLSEGQCMNRKIGHCTWQSVFKRSQKSNTFQAPARVAILHYLILYRLFNLGSESLHNQPDACGIDLPESAVRCNVDDQTNQRRVLVEQSTNLVALPPNVVPPVQLGNVAIPSRSSGSFPAVPNVKKRAPAPTGLSGQLQKAFVTGVPKLNRPELETACEDFSNIISTEDGIATVYKGTLSSGVEIAVISTTVLALEDWSKHSETAFRKKIDTLSRINHKNFVNLIGYCEEDNPFTRIMVSEYAPNGSLFEHLHVEGLDHLDWSARTRIIMGTGYCLQHMHELNPPISHFNLTSKEIFLTEDYAAKVADVGFWRDLVAKSKNPAENESEHSELPPHADAETNAAPSLNDRKNFSSLVDPTLKSHKENELEVICEVIQRCVQQDVRKRP